MPFRPAAGLQPVPGYTLLRELGRGGFGEVWEASAPGEVRVALKFIRLETAQAGPELRALELIRDIRHPHLLDVQFAARVEDCLVIAMPLCDESLLDRLRACRARGLPGVPRDELLGYMGEVAGALDFLNEPRHPAADGRLVGVQHRDVKPQNIFLVGGSARLADFGLAKVYESGGASHSGSMSPHYAAPEEIEGRVSPRSDQYSLAVAYAQLRGGVLPFTGDSVHQVLYAHVHRPPDLSGVPDAERPAVARALEKRPEGRWPSCRDFVLGLAAAAREEDRLATTRTRTTAPAGPSGRREGESASLAGGMTETQAPTWASHPTVGDGGPRGRGPGAARGRRWARPATLGALVVAVAAGLAVVFPPGGRTARRPTKATAPAPAVAAAPRPADAATKEGREVSAPTRPSAAGEGRRDPTVVAIPPTLVALADGPPAGADPQLAARAHAILKTYCHGCHGSTFKVPGLNVLDRDVLVAAPPPGKRRKAAYVVPGKPDDSLLWKRAGVDEDMPPEENPQPSADEKATLSSTSALLRFSY